MGRVYEGIDEKLTTWLQAQPLFVVATAPLSADGLVNCSPKGGVGSFVVLTSTRVAYLDLTGVIPTTEKARAFLDSKDADNRATEVVLGAFGAPVREAAERTADLLLRARG